MTAALEVLHADASLVLGQSGPLMIAVWWDAPSAAQMDVIGRASARILREWGSQRGFAQFVLAGTPRFSAEVRKKANEQTKLYAGQATAHVVEVGGLTGSATRAFLSALILLTQRDKPIKVFSAPADAALWLAEKLGGAPQRWSARRILTLRDQAVSARA
ncbi:MAG: hypothetical protein AB8I08_02035 [Sandaracinaceae bacterium]